MKYLKDELADQIKKDLETGAIRYGEKMPSVRKLSHQFNVSISTVLEAYKYLEDIGYVLSRERSGYFANHSLTEESVYETKLKNSVVSHVKTADLILDIIQSQQVKGIRSFALGTPFPHIMPFKKVNKEIKQYLKLHPDLSAYYVYSPGDIKARTTLSKWLRPILGNTNPNHILMTSGCLEAVHISLSALTKPGDQIAVESPTYFGILQAINNLGLKAVEVPTCSQDGIEPQDLEKVLKNHSIKVLVISCHAQNPFGHLMTDENKRKILDLCEKHNVQIIEDDIYGDLTFTENRPTPLKAFDKKGIVTYCSSLSKSISPGLRIGWCVPQGKNFDDFLKVKIAMNWSCNSIGQAILPHLLDKTNFPTWIHNQKEYYKKQVGVYSFFLKSQLGDRIKINRPSGSYFLWCELSTKINTVELYQEALKSKITFSPGPMFSASGAFKHCFRLNCSAPLTGDTEKALLRLCQLIQKMDPR